MSSANHGANPDEQTFYQAAFAAAMALVVIIGVRAALSDPRHIAQYHQKQVEAAIQEVRFWDRSLEMFDQLDHDRDGLLHQEELRNLALDGNFLEADAAIVQRLYENCARYGHIVGETGEGKVHYSVFAISKVDLKLGRKKALEEQKEFLPQS